MRRTAVLLLLAFLAAAAAARAQGWTRLPGTALAAACPAPSPGGVEGCSAVIADWSGGVADTANKRLIVWGGGHNGYYGNEVYALNLNAPATLTRLNTPSPTDNVATCPEAYVDGKPSSRHTYGGLALIPGAPPQMFSVGGSKADCGGVGTGTWTINLATLQWTRKDPGHECAPNDGFPICDFIGNGAGLGVVSDYDPATGLVWLDDDYELWSYNPATNAYVLRNANAFVGGSLVGQQSGIVDPVRHFFFQIGANVFNAYNIADGSDYALQDWSGQVAASCASLRSSTYPGLAYDAVAQKVVAWLGGDSAVVFDPGTRACVTLTFPGGPGTVYPPGSAQLNGTHGRFRYFPAPIDGFALVNDWQQDAFLLKLR